MALVELVGGAAAAATAALGGAASAAAAAAAAASSARDVLWSSSSSSSHSSDFCAHHNVSYAHRAFDPAVHNWCAVPGGGADALLFAALAVFVSAVLFARLSSVWVLLAGGLFQLLASSINLTHWSNAVTLWLGMTPAMLFFQIFLPPLLLDSATRVDFFLFRKFAAHIIIFAFVNVVVSALAFVPLMLDWLGLSAAGWRPIDAALFGAILGSTDAVAVTAILKAGGAPEMLTVLLEGESLCNDASSIVLFEIFLHKSSAPPAAPASAAAPAAAAPALTVGGLAASSGVSFGLAMAKQIVWLAASGAAAGLLMGLVTRLVLFKWLHRRHVPPHVEAVVPLAGAYTIYLVTEYYIGGSGVIAVVIYGLYGASTFLYGLSSKGLRTGAFARFYDALGFMVNGMIFFYVGASIAHFFVSLSEEVFAGGSMLSLLAALPAVVVAMLLLRGGLMWLEAPLLSLFFRGPSLSWQEVLFATVGGLRGGLALVLVQTMLASHRETADPQVKVVHAQMALLIAAVVLFTLTVNAAALGPLMNWLGLNKPTTLQRHMHRRAQAALSQYTRQTVAELQADDDELLRGVDWAAVTAGADMGTEVKQVLCSGEAAARGAKHARARGGGRMGKEPSAALSARSSRAPAPVPRHSSDQGRQPRSADGDAAAAGASGGSLGSMLKGGGLTVPLLGAQRAGRPRYGLAGGGGGGDESSGDESNLDDVNPAVSGGDLEAGLTARDMQAVPCGSSEKVFIKSRVKAQEQLAAQHAADCSDCPFLAGAEPEDAGGSGSSGARGAGDTQAADASLGGSSPGSATAGAATAEDELGEGGAEVDEDGSADSSQAGQDAGQQGLEQPQFKLLSPVVALRSSDVLAVAASMGGARSWTQPPLEHSGQPLQAHPPAPLAGATPGHGHGRSSSSSSSAGRYGSFISSAAAATTAAGALGVGASGAAVGAQPPQVLHGGRALPAGPDALRRNSVHLLSSVWQQAVSQQLATGSDVLTTATFNPAAGGAGGDEAASEVSDDEVTTQEEYLADARIALLAGFKRHFRFKAAEGLLSKSSLRLLDYACDAALSRPNRPLSLWHECGRDLKKHSLTSVAASLHYRLRRYRALLLRRPARGLGGLLRSLLTDVVSRSSLFLRKRLGGVAVVTLEVALELWLALTCSPQAKLMRHSHTPASALLQEELREQAALVWRFLQDRQVEAPDEFASLQTHRVQLAVARRQLAFVEKLAAIGAVEDAAAEALTEMVERRLHRLEVKGPSWQTPGLMDVLRRQPALATAPEGLLMWLRAYAELKSYAPGQCIVPRRRSGPPGIFIVLSGLVRAEVHRFGRTEQRFVGVGGSIGLLGSLLGKDAPGMVLVAAFAQGNALGRGPLVLHLPMRLLDTVRQRAAPAIEAAAGAGAAISSLADHEPAELAGAAMPGGQQAGGIDGVANEAACFAQLLLDLHRQAGVLWLDRLAEVVVRRLTQHLEQAAEAIFAHASQLPPAKASACLSRLLEALLGSAPIAATVLGASPAAAAAASIELPADLACFDPVTSTALTTALGSSPSSSLGWAAPSHAADGGSRSPAGNADATAEAEADASLALLRRRSGTALLRLRDLLRSADLVTLPAGEIISQGSSILLLSGTLRLRAPASPAAAAAAAGLGSGATKAATARGAGQPPQPSPQPKKRVGFFSRGDGRNRAAAGSASVTSTDAPAAAAVEAPRCLAQYAAPALIAWAPELFASFEERYERRTPCYVAGAGGALLLVTPGGAPAAEASLLGSAEAPAGAQPFPSAEAASSERQLPGHRQHSGAVTLSSLVPLQRSVAPGVEADEPDA